MKTRIRPCKQSELSLVILTHLSLWHLLFCPFVYFISKHCVTFITLRSFVAVFSRMFLLPSEQKNISLYQQDENLYQSEPWIICWLCIFSHLMHYLLSLLPLWFILLPCPGIQRQWLNHINQMCGMLQLVDHINHVFWMLQMAQWILLPPPPVHRDQYCCLCHWSPSLEVKDDVKRAVDVVAGFWGCYVLCFVEREEREGWAGWLFVQKVWIVKCGDI